MIDTTTPYFKEDLLDMKDDLEYEKLKKGEYDSGDIALVRVTDVFPYDGVIHSLSNVPFVHKINDLPHEVAVTNILNLDEKKQGLSMSEQIDLTHEISEQAREYSPYSTQYRSTVHFCLNGVVSPHIMGQDLVGRPYAIIDFQKHHESDTNIVAVRGEDTYFEDQFNLSPDAIVLVDEKYVDNLANQNITGNFKVQVYRGDQKLAVEKVLLDNGIVPETIGTDYILSSPTSSMIGDYIDSKGYAQDKHCYSMNYRHDDEKNLDLWDKYAKDFYNYLYEQVYGDKTNYLDDINYLSKAGIYDREAFNKLSNFINSIGVDKYKKIVDSYNNAILERVKSGSYPNNKEILDGASLGMELCNKQVK